MASFEISNARHIIQSLNLCTENTYSFCKLICNCCIVIFCSLWLVDAYTLTTLHSEVNTQPTHTAMTCCTSAQAMLQGRSLLFNCLHLLSSIWQVSGRYKAGSLIAQYMAGCLSLLLVLLGLGWALLWPGTFAWVLPDWSCCYICGEFHHLVSKCFDFRNRWWW